MSTLTKPKPEESETESPPIEARKAVTTTAEIQALMQGMKKMPAVLNSLGFSTLREGRTDR